MKSQLLYLMILLLWSILIEHLEQNYLVGQISMEKGTIAFFFSLLGHRTDVKSHCNCTHCHCMSLVSDKHLRQFSSSFELFFSRIMQTMLILYTSTNFATSNYCTFCSMRLVRLCIKVILQSYYSHFKIVIM